VRIALPRSRGVSAFANASTANATVAVFAARIASASPASTRGERSSLEFGSRVGMHGDYRFTRSTRFDALADPLQRNAMREEGLRHGTDCVEVIHGLQGARAALDPLQASGTHPPRPRPTRPRTCAPERSPA